MQNFLMRPFHLNADYRSFRSVNEMRIPRQQLNKLRLPCFLQLQSSDHELRMPNASEEKKFKYANQATAYHPDAGSTNFVSFICSYSTLPARVSMRSA